MKRGGLSCRIITRVRDKILFFFSRSLALPRARASAHALLSFFRSCLSFLSLSLSLSLFLSLPSPGFMINHGSFSLDFARARARVLSYNFGLSHSVELLPMFGTCLSFLSLCFFLSFSFSLSPFLSRSRSLSLFLSSSSSLSLSHTLSLSVSLSLALSRSCSLSRSRSRSLSRSREGENSDVSRKEGA